MTQCTALRGKLKAAISPGMHFPKYGNRKKGQSTVNEQKKNKQSLCPSHRAHYLDPRGKRRCSSTKALALDKHKLNSKRKKRKKRKCNKTKNTKHKNSQYTQNTTTEICHLDERFKPAGFVLFFHFCFLKDYSSLSCSALFCIGPRRKLPAAHN